MSERKRDFLLNVVANIVAALLLGLVAWLLYDGRRSQRAA